MQKMKRTVMIRAKWNYCCFFFLHILTHHSSVIVIISDSLFHYLIWINHSAIKLKAEHVWKQKKAINWKIQFTWRKKKKAALKNIRRMCWTERHTCTWVSSGGGGDLALRRACFIGHMLPNLLQLPIMQQYPSSVHTMDSEQNKSITTLMKVQLTESK